MAGQSWLLSLLIYSLRWGDALYNGFFVCFPSLLECGFESRLGLEFSAFCMWHFLKPFVGGFLWFSGFLPSFIG